MLPRPSVSIEISLVARLVFSQRLFRLIGHHQRQAFGSNNMIGRQRTTSSNRIGILSTSKRVGARRSVKTSQHSGISRSRNQAPQSSQGESSYASAGILERPTFAEKIFCLRHKINHAAVTFSSIVGKRKQPMTHKDDTFKCSPIHLLSHSPNSSGQIKTRHDVRHNQNPISIDRTDRSFALGCIANRHNGIGMAMVHVTKRDNGVEDGFNRRIWRSSIEQCHPLRRHHIRI